MPRIGGRGYSVGHLFVFGNQRLKDYAKIVREPPREMKPRPEKPGLARTAIDKNQQAQAAASSKKLLYIVVAVIVAVVLGSAYRQHLNKGVKLSAKAAQGSASVSSASGSPQFDFYSVLPSGNNPEAATTPANDGSSSTTAAPVATISTGTATTTAVATTSAASASSAAAPAASTASTSYSLSAGSYPNSADAQQMLSQLLLLGVDAKVVTVQNNGSAAYQVEVGPFADQDTMNIVKQQLSSHSIPVSVISQ